MHIHPQYRQTLIPTYWYWNSFERKIEPFSILRLTTPQYITSLGIKLLTIRGVLIWYLTLSYKSWNHCQAYESKIKQERYTIEIRRSFEAYDYISSTIDFASLWKEFITLNEYIANFIVVDQSQLLKDLIFYF